MQRYAPLINSALLLLSVWTGYGALDLDALRNTNPDKYLCIAVLVMMPIFAFGAVSIFGASHSTLPRPSWRRVAFSWWRDPLQALFISTYAVGGMALGAALHFYGATGTKAFGCSWCSFACSSASSWVRFSLMHITALGSPSPNQSATETGYDWLQLF